MMKRRPFLQNFSALGLSCMLLGALSGPALADSDDDPGHESRQPLLRPTSVVSSSGNVQNAEALVGDRQGYATLTMVQGGAAPMIILDYGHDVGGLPVFEVSSFSGTPQLQAIYSEAQQNLLPAGDGAPAFPNAPGDPSRVDTYPVSGPGLIVNRLIQGGERFEAITLTAPGTVTLRAVAIRSTTFHPPRSANRGYFRSSDSRLDEVWGLGAYTLSLDQLPAGAVPPLWQVTPQGVDVQYSPVALYQGGGGWTDYTATFEVQVVVNEAAWIVRDNVFGVFRLTLDADNDTLGSPNVLRVVQPSFTSAVTPITTVQLPFNLQPGTWHSVQTVALGSQISVYLDGRLLTTFDGSQSLFGSFGFQNALGAEALFCNLSVVSASGQTLYASGLTDSSALDVFAAGTTPLPSIMDGPRRDRLTFAGDMSLAGPTVYYSNGASDYVAGSLRRFGGFLRSDGEASSVLSPLLKPGVVVSDNLAAPNGGFYSLSYSTHFLNDLYDYYLYTGDLDLVTALWPAVQGELAYLRSTVSPQTNPQAPDLLNTDTTNGFNWNVNPLAGTVTEYNAQYYRALQNTAALARVLGHQNEAAALTQLGALVKSELNATLFDAAAGLYDLSNLDRTTVAQDGNTLAVLYGLAPAGQGVSVLQAMETALQTPQGPMAFSSGSGASLISPFISGFDVHAHFEVGDAAGALSLIRTVWAQHMTHDTPFYSGGVFEALALDGTPQNSNTSLAHAWSSGPTSALSKYVLGVRPVEPGYRKWLVEPQPGDLSWAEGTVPTPYGPIEVEWKKEGNRFVLEVSVPAGTSGTIGMPFSGNASSIELNVNGHAMKGGKNAMMASAAHEQLGSRAGYVYLNNLSAGTYQILTP